MEQGHCPARLAPLEKRMKTIVFVVVCGALTLVPVLGAQAPPAPIGSWTPTAADVTPECQVTDLMPAFWEYWDLARDRDAAAQDRLFTQMLQQPYPDVYGAILRVLPISQAALLERAMRLTQPVEPTLRRLSAQLSADLPRELTAFQQSFPTFRCTAPVYFVFAAGAFDGATRQVGDRRALLFGLDVVAQVHATSPRRPRLEHTRPRFDSGRDCRTRPLTRRWQPRHQSTDTTDTTDADSRGARTRLHLSASACPFTDGALRFAV